MASPLHPPSSAPYSNCIFLAGPTAVGKSEIALLLAENIGGEIISVDSMQVYRGLDIGTAKPSAAERARVWHHLIDVVDLRESFDAAQFVRLANEAVTKIQARGHVPIFCGGTGLYFKGFLHGLGEAPPADEKLRAELESKPLAELLDELAKKDPVTFDEIDCNNPRRIVRAVEVIRLTGKPFSQQRSKWAETRPKIDSAVGGKNLGLDGVSPHLFGFARQREDLSARIDERVEAMFARGLVEETRQLLEGGLAQNKTAMQALGYRQVVEHLRGEHSLPETIELVKIKTRQFAKRQLTWFRNQLNLQWIELEREQELLSIAERIGNNR